MYILSAKDWLGTAIDSMYTDKLYSYTDKLDAGYEKKMKTLRRHVLGRPILSFPLVLPKLFF